MGGRQPRSDLNSGLRDVVASLKCFVSGDAKQRYKQRREEASPPNPIVQEARAFARPDRRQLGTKSELGWPALGAFMLVAFSPEWAACRHRPVSPFRKLMLERLLTPETGHRIAAMVSASPPAQRDLTRPTTEIQDSYARNPKLPSS